VLPSLELNYGASDNLELHFLAGLAFDRQSPSGARFGSGDVELGVKYRFIEADEAGWRPDVAFAPALDLPAGDRRRALGTGHAHAFLPLILGRSFEPWSAFGEVGYAVRRRSHALSRRRADLGRRALPYQRDGDRRQGKHCLQYRRRL